MQSLKVLKQKHTFPETIERAIRFQPPKIRSDGQLFDAFAQASNRFTTIGSGLQTVCSRYLDFQFDPPAIEALDASAAALPYIETLQAMQHRLRFATNELATALNVPQVGRIIWMDDESCQFTYYEVIKERGFLNNTLCRIAHQHDLVKARQHKLPCDDLPMPKRARQILRAIPAALVPDTRVITGLEVRKLTGEESRRQERTLFGQALDGGKRQARSAARATGAGAAAVGGALAAGLAGLFTTLTAPLAVVDPAIVIGEICLFGWDN